MATQSTITKQHNSKLEAARAARLAAARAIRTCLKCGRTFDSKGPHNRICPECKHAHWNKDCKLVEVDDYMPRTATIDPAMKATLRGMTGRQLAG